MSKAVLEMINRDFLVRWKLESVKGFEEEGGEEGRVWRKELI